MANAPQKKKRGRGIFAPRPMSGMGGLGNQAQKIEQGGYRSEPGDREHLQAFEKGGVHRAGPPSKPVTRTPPLDPITGDDKFTKIISMMPAKRINITARPDIGSTKPLRIDVGIADRTDILIANMSSVVIWLNTHSQFGTGRGYPLAAASEAGAYNGGTLSIECTKDVPWYALAASGATNLVVILEASR